MSFFFRKSKLIIYDLETNNLSEAVISRLAENQAADQGTIHILLKHNLGLF